MLPDVSYQENTVVRMQAVHKVMHLLGRSKRTLVKDVEPFLASVGLLPFGEMRLQS
jgi:hypothetical protein